METIRTINIIKDYKVIVGCMTYNHSKYIVDALNGFAMQQTDFPFVCIVMDDASTDGEQEVIKNWLHNECDMARAEYYDLELSDVIIVPHKENANCTMAVYFLKRNLYQEENLKFGLVGDWVNHCEYIALCEGDDYWTDSKKLQIQSDCLDTHTELDMCAHSIVVKSAKTGYKIKQNHNITQQSSISVDEIIVGGGGCLGFRSILFRKCLMLHRLKFREYYDIDYSLFLHGALRGGIFYINREMAVYRKNVDNSWSYRHFADIDLHKKHIENQVNMLKIFDDETSFKYHNSVLAGILFSEITYSNTVVENLKILLNSQKGFSNLPCKKKFVVIIKGLFPRASALYVKKRFNH